MRDLSATAGNARAATVGLVLDEPVGAWGAGRARPAAIRLVSDDVEDHGRREASDG